LAALVYFIAIPFIYLLSLLPFGLLYLISDFVFFIIYHLVGYRKQVVKTNLRNAFPTYTGQQIDKITHDFYKYFCDLLLETFKTLTISQKSMLRHCTLSPTTQQLFDRLNQEKKSVILVLGHFGNWEWAGNTFSLLCHQQLYVIYHPLHNKYFDGLMYRMRTRFGTRLIAMKNVYKDMLKNKGAINTTAFIADQTPSPDNAYWTIFLNQDTPVFKGTEVIAKKLDLPVVYTRVRRVKRGYYEIDADILHNSPRNTVDGEITELHTKRLEQDIMLQPEIWLWSHRRWKHKRK